MPQPGAVLAGSRVHTCSAGLQRVDIDVGGLLRKSIGFEDWMLAGNSWLPVCRGLLSDRGIDCLGLERDQYRQYKSCCGGNQKCATES